MADARGMLKGFVGFSVVPIVTGLITIFVIPVVSHVFPEAEYGRVNLFYSMGLLLMTFCTLGLDSSLIRYYFEPPEGLTNKALEVITLIVGIAVDALLIVVAFFLFPQQVSVYLFGEENYPLIIALGVYTAALVAFRVINTDARMQMQQLRYNVQSIIQCFVTKILFVFVALAVSTYYSYSIIAMTIGMVVVAAWFMFAQRKSLSLKEACISRANIRKLLAFGIPMMATSFVLNLNGMIGKLALSSAGLYAAVGIFAIATTLSNVFAIIPAAFSTYWSPFMYEHYSTDQETIERVHDLVMWGSGSIVAAVIALQDALFLIVGGEYATCQPYFMIIMLNPIQALICETTSYGIVIKEKPIYNVIASACGVIASAIVTILFMESMGAFAAALGVAASSLVIGLSRSIIGQHYYSSIPSPKKTLFVAMLIIAACCLNGYFCQALWLEVVVGVVLLFTISFLYRKRIWQLIQSLKKGNSKQNRPNILVSERYRSL